MNVKLAETNYLVNQPTIHPSIHPSIHPPIHLSIHPSMALQPFLGPDLPSEDASLLLCLLLVSSILLFLGFVICPSGRRPPILFLVFPLVLYYEISH